jgi:hypothetical protein
MSSKFTGVLRGSASLIRLKLPFEERVQFRLIIAEYSPQPIHLRGTALHTNARGFVRIGRLKISEDGFRWRNAPYKLNL